MNPRNLTSYGAGGSSPEPFMAYIVDDDSLAVVRSWAERQGYSSAVVHQGGPDMFSQVLESTPAPKLAVIDIDGQIDPVGAAARLVSLCGPASKLIIIGSANDVGLYRRMLGFGVIDYLVKPLTTDTLNQALQAAMRGQKGTTSDVKEAKTIVVLGVRGGMGATTVAVNTGWLLSHELGYNCALLDLDLQFGTSALALDLQPGRGLRDIISSPHRVDALMITSSIVQESEHFSVLGGEESVDEPVLIESSAIAALLGEMRHTFDFIFVDLPRHLLASQKRLLTSAHTIILVTELSLAGIRDTLRIKTALANLGYTGTVRCLATRVHTTRPGQVDVKSFEKGAQTKIDLVIPEDTRAVTEASNSGKALGEVAKNAPITKALLTLCQKISATEGKISGKKNGILQRLAALAQPQKPGSKS